MSEALYERYKDALRRGHVAALHDRHAAALGAYTEAAGIASDRALPLVAIGGVLTRLGKHAEALAAYDAALERSATDEGALRGRAELLAMTGDRVGSAETFDRLATSLDGLGRLPDAADAARSALESAESRGRRTTMRAFVARLKEASADPAAGEALARASSVLEGQAPGRPRSATGPDLIADPDEPGDGESALEEGAEVVAAAEPEPPAEPPPPPFDPLQAISEVEEAVQGDDPLTARTLALAAAAGHRAAGQPSTAIDACYMALAGTPADPGLHLALAEIYLDQGWRAVAIQKLELLDRLADLTDDRATHELVCAIVAARLPDEPRLTEPCA